jgi:hypothetical protein
MTPIDQLLWGGFAVAVAVSAALAVLDDDNHLEGSQLPDDPRIESRR